MIRHLSLVLVAAVVAVSAHARHITLEETITVQSINSAAIAPDGKMAAFTKVIPRQPYIDDDGTAYIELQAIRADGTIVPFITGKESLSSIQLHDNGIYFLARRGEVKHTSLYRIATDGGEAQLIFSHDSAMSSYALSSDGRDRKSTRLNSSHVKISYAV